MSNISIIKDLYVHAHKLKDEAKIEIAEMLLDLTSTPEEDAIACAIRKHPEWEWAAKWMTAETARVDRLVAAMDEQLGFDRPPRTLTPIEEARERVRVANESGTVTELHIAQADLRKLYKARKK